MDFRREPEGGGEEKEEEGVRERERNKIVEIRPQGKVPAR